MELNNNEEELDWSDYILALVPVIMFSYPVFIIILLESSVSWYFSNRVILGNIFLGVFTVVALLGWSLKVKNSTISSDKGGVLFIIDLVLFAILIRIYSSVLTIDEPFFNFWNLTVGIILLVLLKFISDLHSLPRVYNGLMKKLLVKTD